MTLVELLVVISILGLLAVTVIPNFSNPGERRKVREAARAVSSFIAGGQSRALGSRAGGGVWIDPLANTISGSTGISIGAAIDLAEADVPAPYAGDSTLSTVTFAAASLGNSSSTVTFSENCTPPSGTNNLLIRFGSTRTLFALTLLSLSGSTGTVSMRSEVSQSVTNTSWPRPNMPTNYEIIGPPTRSTASTLTLGDGVALDLYHSCSGTNRLQSLAIFSSGTAPFQIIYDKTGRPDYLSCNSSRAAINDPLFLLVASIESIQNSGSLAPTDGYWVAIDPRGGIPKVAEVYASGTTLVQQQKYIREGAVQQGR